MSGSVDGTARTRACELWNDGERALAHIHLAHIGLPLCDEERALRLFAADELLESGATPEALLKAQGFDPAPLALHKYNPDQPRVPAGNGRASGQWTSEGAGTGEGIVEGRSAATGGSSADDSITVASIEKDKSKAPSNAEPEQEHTAPLHPEGHSAVPGGEGAQDTAPSRPNPSDFIGQDFGQFGVGVETPDLSINRLSDHGEFRADTRGVSPDDLQSTVENPLLVLQQSSGRFFYLSDKAVVVLDREGTVVTTYPASKFDARIKAMLNYVYETGGK